MKLLRNKKEGISLVALIVTIIVLIILTGAVIVTFMEGGIVDRAKDAVARNDLATLKEVYSLKYNKKKIDVDIGETEGIDEIAALMEATNELKLKGFSYADGTVTYTGDNKYISEWIDSEFIYKSLTEGGYYFTKIDGKTYMTGLKVGDNWETAGDILSKLGENYAIYDNNGTEVEDSSAKVTTGYVIKQGDTEYATVVVKGDINSDIDITPSDSTQILYECIANRHSTAALLACDVNNDGIISQDDSGLILLKTINVDELINVNDIQKTNLNPITSRVNDYIYIWHDEQKIYTLLNESGFNVDRNQCTITIESGTTYEQVKNDILALFSISGVEIEFNWGGVQNLNDIVEEGDCIGISTPTEKVGTEYYLGAYVELEVQLQ